MLRQIRNGHHWPVRTLSSPQVSQRTSEASEGFFVSAPLIARFDSVLGPRFSDKPGQYLRSANVRESLPKAANAGRVAPDSEPAGDYVQIVLNAVAGTTTISVDSDGAEGGSNFVDVAVINGYSPGALVNSLLEDGNLKL
jgi:hypothetical protein